MDSDVFEGQWKQLKGCVRQQWGKLTDDDVNSLSGRKEELVQKLQELYDIPQEKAEKEVNDWALVVLGTSAAERPV